MVFHIYKVDLRKVIAAGKPDEARQYGTLLYTEAPPEITQSGGMCGLWGRTDRTGM